MSVSYVEKQTYRRTEEVIGQGTSATVCKGQHITTVQTPSSIENVQTILPVAIKVFNDLKGGLYEAALLKSLNDLNFPHIIRYRSYQLNEKPELVLDLIPAENLFDLRHKISWSDIITITEQLVEVFTLLDECSYIHGDLKLENLLYEKRSRYITVIDWGLACNSSRSCVLESPLEYDLIQTYSERAPEIFLGMGHTTRTDLWSLGIIIYQLVTKQNLAVLEEYADLADEENTESRKQSLQNLFSRIGLPSAYVVEKIKDKLHCPWFTKNGQVCWKEPFKVVPLPPWKFVFKNSASRMQASPQDIGLYASILDKIFRFADRPSIKEIREEFALGRSEELKFRITGIGPNQILKICSDDITVVFDNTLNVYRSCLHVPQNPSGKYLLTLIEDRNIIVNKFSTNVLEHTKLEIDIPALIKRSRLTS